MPPLQTIQKFIDEVRERDTYASRSPIVAEFLLKLAVKAIDILTKGLQEISDPKAFLTRVRALEALEQAARILEE